MNFKKKTSLNGWEMGKIVELVVTNNELKVLIIVDVVHDA